MLSKEESKLRNWSSLIVYEMHTFRDVFAYFPNRSLGIFIHSEHLLFH